MHTSHRWSLAKPGWPVRALLLLLLGLMCVRPGAGQDKIDAHMMYSDCLGFQVNQTQQILASINSLVDRKAMQKSPFTTPSIYNVFASVLSQCAGRTIKPLRDSMSLNTMDERVQLGFAVPVMEQGMGLKLNVTLLPWADQIQLRLSELRARSSKYDAWTFDGASVLDMVDSPAGGFLDLSPFIAHDGLTIMWQDFHPYFRQGSTVYDGSVLGIPSMSFQPMFSYQRETLARLNISVPNTWDEFVDVAIRLNGTDYTGDRTVKYSLCFEANLFPQNTFLLTMIFASYVQTQGPSQGILWDPGTMEPLVGTPAMVRALEIFQTIASVSRLNNNLNFTASPQFPDVSRCVMHVGGSEYFKASANIRHARFKGRLGFGIVPGASEVLDRSTNRLVPCTPDLCFDSVRLANGTVMPINRAPHYGPAALSLAVNPFADAMYMYPVWKTMSQMLTDSGGSKIELTDANLKDWTINGYHLNDTISFFRATTRTLSHRNLVGDISIRGMWRYRLAMNNAIQRLLYRNFSPAQTAEYLDTQFRQIYAEEAGNNASSVAEAYRKFLHYVPPPPPAPPPPRSNVTAPPPPPPEAPAVPVSAGKRSFAWQVIVGAVVGVLVAGCVLVCGWRRVVFARRHHRTLWGGKVVPPLSGAEATLMLAAVHDCEALYQEMPDTMAAALHIFRSLVTEVANDQDGYMCSDSSSDQVLVAFHTPMSALTAATDLQSKMMHANWPAKLLSHPLCQPAYLTRNPEGHLSSQTWARLCTALSPDASRPNNKALPNTHNTPRSDRSLTQITTHGLYRFLAYLGKTRLQGAFTTDTDTTTKRLSQAMLFKEVTALTDHDSNSNSNELLSLSGVLRAAGGGQKGEDGGGGVGEGGQDYMGGSCQECTFSDWCQQTFDIVTISPERDTDKPTILATQINRANLNPLSKSSSGPLLHVGGGPNHDDGVTLTSSDDGGRSSGASDALTAAAAPSPRLPESPFVPPAPAARRSPTGVGDARVLVERGLRLSVSLHSGLSNKGDVVRSAFPRNRVQYAGETLHSLQAVSACARPSSILLSPPTFQQLPWQRIAQHACILQAGTLQKQAETTEIGLEGDCGLYELIPHSLVLTAVAATLHTCTAPRAPQYHSAPCGNVSVAYLQAVGIPSLMVWNSEVTRVSISLFMRVAVPLLDDFNGYLLDSSEALGVLAAFPNSADAVRWALLTMHCLKLVDWPEELLTHPLAEEMFARKTVAFRVPETHDESLASRTNSVTDDHHHPHNSFTNRRFRPTLGRQSGQHNKPTTLNTVLETNNVTAEQPSNCQQQQVQPQPPLAKGLLLQATSSEPISPPLVSKPVALPATQALSRAVRQQCSDLVLARTSLGKKSERVSSGGIEPETSHGRTRMSVTHVLPSAPRHSASGNLVLPGVDAASSLAGGRSSAAAAAGASAATATATGNSSPLISRRLLQTSSETLPAALSSTAPRTRKDALHAPSVAAGAGAAAGGWSQQLAVQRRMPSYRHSRRSQLSAERSTHNVDSAGTSNELLFRGLRLKCGIDIGPVRVGMNNISARLAYSGPVMNRAARILSVTRCGQVWCSESAWTSASQAYTFPVPEDSMLVFSAARGTDTQRKTASFTIPSFTSSHAPDITASPPPPHSPLLRAHRPASTTGFPPPAVGGGASDGGAALGLATGRNSPHSGRFSGVQSTLLPPLDISIPAEIESGSESGHSENDEANQSDHEGAIGTRQSTGQDVSRAIELARAARYTGVHGTSLGQFKLKSIKEECVLVKCVLAAPP